MKETKALFEIIKSFLENKECSFSEEVDEEKLYNLAKKNEVSNFLINWANTKCKSENIKNKIINDYDAQILRDTNENIELDKILNEFEEENINTIVIKGAIMKYIYPQNYMRQMCDIDIMVQENNFKKASEIMTNCGYEKFYNHEKELIFTKKPFGIVELHRKLMSSTDTGYQYFENVWERGINYKTYKNIYKLSLEDTYIYCILHLLIHLKFTGIEIRDILDIYLYNEKYKNEIDYNKVNDILGEYDVVEFEKNIKNISYKWFSGEEIQDFDEVEQFILSGRSAENMVNYSISNYNNKKTYLFRLFFPEFKVMKGKYPVLKKAPVLLPAMWIARIFKDILSKDNSVKNRLDTIKLIQNSKEEEVEKTKNIYKKLGIEE